MAIKPIEKLEEAGFPRGVKAKINELIKRLSRPVEYKYRSDNARRVDVLDTDEKTIIKLPWGIGGSSVTDHPFQGLLRQIDGTWYRGVAYDSVLWLSKSYTDTQAITGMLTSATPTDADTGWIETAANDVVWLQGEITAGSWPTLTSVEIHSTEADDDWDGGEIEHDGGDAGSPVEYFEQSFFRLALFKVTTAASGGLEILPSNQFTRTHLMLEKTNETAVDSGGSEPVIVPALYPYPR